MVVSIRRWLVTLAPFILTLRGSTGLVWTRQESLWLLTGDSCRFAREKTPLMILEVASLRKQDCEFCECLRNGKLCSRGRSWAVAVMLIIGDGGAVNFVAFGLHKDIKKDI